MPAKLVNYNSLNYAGSLGSGQHPASLIATVIS